MDVWCFILNFLWNLSLSPRHYLVILNLYNYRIFMPQLYFWIVILPPRLRDRFYTCEAIPLCERMLDTIVIQSNKSPSHVLSMSCWVLFPLSWLLLDDALAFTWQPNLKNTYINNPNQISSSSFAFLCLSCF